ncbi:lipopolysaccharide biosynthesis protein [Paraburkholderia sediminicola]|uniref:lipopolysaccharide biosynthesis protein n=1 Tax=Paraburkholderia sediminicola TaxID=458836 RepID=UPI0038B6F327
MFEKFSHFFKRGFLKAYRFSVLNSLNPLLNMVVRVLGGLASAGPAVLALQYLDKASYGRAASNYALALVLVGPISQYCTQGYLRQLVNNISSRRGDLFYGKSAIAIYLMFATVALALASTLHLIGYDDFIFTESLMVIVVLMRMQEAYYVSRDWQRMSIIFFYVSPPMAICLVIFLLKKLTTTDDYLLVSIAQLVSFSSAVIASMLLKKDSLIYIKRWRAVTTWQDLGKEFSSVRVFLLNGAMLSATEQIPIILLRQFGLGAAIPAFELVRKLCSVPSILVHALSMFFLPRLIASERDRAWHDFRNIFFQFSVVLAFFGLAYVVTVLMATAFLSDMGSSLVRHVDFPVLWALLAAATVTSLAAPSGAALIALRGETWWTIGGLCSLTIQLVTCAIAAPRLASAGVAISVLAQNIVLSCIVAWASHRLLNVAQRNSGFTGSKVDPYQGVL